MNVILSERWGPFIRSQVQSGRYATEGEVLDEALELLSRRGEASANPSETTKAGPVPAWRRVLDNMQSVPDEDFDRIPADSSEQLDHDLYGTPKRPSS